MKKKANLYEKRDNFSKGKRKLRLPLNFGNANTLGTKKRRDILFCAIVLLYPTLQFCIFYLGVNINSILLAFKSFDRKTGYSWAGLDNFKQVIYNIFHLPQLQMGLVNSILLYAFSLLIGMTLALLFAYYIYQKRLFHGFFKFMLFLPAIVSPLVLSLVFKTFVNSVYPEVMKKFFGSTVQGLLYGSTETAKITMIIFTIWISFGVNVLIFTGSMSSINESIIEQAEIDGVNQFQKFIHVIFPSIFPTFTTFIVAQIVTIFTSQMNLYSVYYGSAPYQLYTIGYYLYRQTSAASLAEYPYLSAAGILFSLVSIPLTFLVKFLLERIGPRED